MLSGSRMINAIELQKIAEFLNVSMESLVKVPQVIQETNTVKAFMGMVESQEVKEGLAIADEIAIPYRAAVLRLFEEEKIDIKTAKKLLQISDDEISKQIEVTGKAVRWQEIPRGLIRFGSLSEKMYELEQWESAPIMQVLDDIYDGKFQLLKNGDLQYLK